MVIWLPRCFAPNVCDRQGSELEACAESLGARNPRQHYGDTSHDVETGPPRSMKMGTIVSRCRLVVHVSFTFGRVLVKFIGTQAEYDRIDPETVSWRKNDPSTSLRSGLRRGAPGDRAVLRKRTEAGQSQVHSESSITTPSVATARRASFSATVRGLGLKGS